MLILSNGEPDYSIGPTKLKVLKEQLKELLEQINIWPSTSPLGAHVGMSNRKMEP